MQIIAAILIFTLVVLVHELGHFWAARRAGIFVEEFSIGMGPRLLSFVKNDTRFSLKAFPIGGSCLMRGEDETSDGDNSFSSKAVGWRIFTISAGALMNFVLALVLLTILALFTSSAETMVRDFSENSPVQAAGLQIGDRIVRANGRAINVHGTFWLQVQRANGGPVDVVVDRGGELLNFTVTPQYHEGQYRLGFFTGVAAGPFAEMPQGDVPFWINRLGIFESLAHGFYSMVFSIELVMYSLGQLITGNFSFADMMGPLGIVAAVGEQIEGSAAVGGGVAALWAALSFAAIISANLGVFNLLPLPALDGGRLVFLSLEAIRRKPINPDKEGMVHFVGLMALMVLIAFITYQDILRLFS